MIEVRIEKAANGYVLRLFDVYSETVFVYTTFADLVDKIKQAFGEATLSDVYVAE